MRNGEAAESKAPAWDIGGTSIPEQPSARRLGCGPAASARPPRRSHMAVGSELGSTRSRRGGAPHQGALAARRLRQRIVRRELRANLQGAEESLLPRRRGRADPVARLDRGVDVGAQRLRRRRQDDAGCRRSGQFRAHQQSAPRGEGRRPQLSGNVERRRLAPHLDAPHERDHNARRLRRRGLRRKRGAATRCVDRAGRNLGPCVQRGDRPKGAATCKAAAA